MTNQVATQQKNNLALKSTTELGKAQEYYMEEIGKIAQINKIQLDAEQTMCGTNMIAAMYNLAVKDGKKLNDFNRNEIAQILQKATMLRLNVSSEPHECYLITRNKKVGETWVKTFEFGIEGDGNDKLLRKYGVDVKKVYKFWEVRENDEFTYPSFNGLEITPPTWKPKDYQSKVVRIVYPIEKTDETIEWNIAEREGVRINLLAHINQNIMKDKEYTEAKKYALIKRIENFNLDELFKDDECLKIMSPAWSSLHSRESMIIRKMRNNATRKYPKEFSSAFQAITYQEAIEDTNSPQIPNAEEVLEVEITKHAKSERLEVPVAIDEETGEVINQATTSSSSNGKKSKNEKLEHFDITEDDIPF